MKTRIYLALIVFVLASADANAGIFNRSSDAPPSQTRAELYDPAFVRQNLTVHKSTTADVEKLYGKPERPSFDSNGTERWSYTMSTKSDNGLARSAVVRGVSALWSHVPSNHATNIGEAEYNKANGGNGSASAVADKTVGKETTSNHSISFVFKDGVLDSYSMN
ncbi:hypothetical protein L2Y94_18850 [Luteibacter aegosomatis]|uniref:hypothetical protein n=1 Tax=Luteibacter aegosomatis TaxID=2911537 RepID=UPI001FFAF724|nr:hypothetical protein [Luteibacter aegosomatis]UPG85338.1 hypothetical protein L2Y94_18850 [Luteibacter aegosomatis]